jgi:hypothetical protein
MTVLTALCPSCSSGVELGQSRCADCGQVLGEHNRCEHCSALTPAVDENGKLTCHACGEPRTLRAGMVVVKPRELARSLTRARITQRVATVFAWFSALVGLSMAALFGLFGQNAVERGAGLLIATVAAVFTFLLARVARAARLRQAARVRADLEQRLMGLAAQRKGMFSAEDAARHLGIGVAEANAMLEGLVRTLQADMEVSERGEIKFALDSSRRAGGVRLSEAPRPSGGGRKQAQPT